MKPTLKSEVFLEYNLMSRLRCQTKDVGSIKVFYGLYELSDNERTSYYIVVSDSEDTKYRQVSKVSEAIECYSLISENGVDTASFDGVLDDYFILKAYNNIL